MYSDFTVEEKQTLVTINFDDMWTKILKRQCYNIFKYPNLRLFVNAIRSLPHSNANSERAFSMLTNLKTKTRNRLLSISVNAACVLKSVLKTRNETALNMKITNIHL